MLLFEDKKTQNISILFPPLSVNMKYIKLDW